MIPVKPIYLDYMATTPIDPRVSEVMLRYMGPEGDFGNPSATNHYYGQLAAKAVERARLQIADSIRANFEEIVFTSGATEANNLAILGAARFYQRKGRHVITLSTEHKAVLDSFQQLAREGFEVTYLQPESDGLLDLAKLNQAIREDTILVSIMQVNNEIGVIQDIPAIADLLRDKGVIFHVDAAQSAGKLALNLNTLGVSLLSLSAHKNYGPKGIGALYVRQNPRIRLLPLSFGGSQENGLRAGTLATHQIVGMGEAFALSESLREAEQKSTGELRDLLWKGIQHLPSIQLNGTIHKRVAGNLNVSFGGIDEERLASIFHRVAASKTSACMAAISKPSYVLRALGLTPELAYRSLRLCVGRFTTKTDILNTIEYIGTMYNG